MESVLFVIDVKSHILQQANRRKRVSETMEKLTSAEIVKSLESLLDRMRAYESQQASIGKGLVEDIISMYNCQKAEIESLKADKIIAERHEKDARELYKDVVIQLKTAKSEAYRECVERVKQVFGGNNIFETCVRFIGDSILNELTQNLHGTCTEGGNEDG